MPSAGSTPLTRAALALGCVGLLSSSALGCTFTSPDGDLQYDFDALASQNYWELTDSNGFVFLYSMCAPVSCGSQNMTMATKGPTRANCIQGFGSYARPTTGTLPASADAEDGLQVSFTGGPRCGGLAQASSSVVYNVHCGPAGDTTPYSQSSVSVSSDGCTATFDIVAPAGCPLELPGGGDDLSGGWVFLIILFCTTLVYCGGGMLFKAGVKKATGMEIVPNVDFWRSVAGNISLGAAVVWGAITCSPAGVDDAMYQGLDDDLGLDGDAHYSEAPSTSAGAV